MAKGQGRVGEDRDAIVGELPAACSDESKALEFLERTRWGTEPKCARCESPDVYQMQDRATGGRSKRALWRCRSCGEQYTVRTGTVLEDSRIPLRHWCYAFWAACASKKGVSALQIKRMTGLSYKSALFLMHRIRWAMAEDHSAPPKLTGIVEADETFVGGKPRYRKRESRAALYRKKGIVMAMVQRDGEVRTKVLERVSAGELRAALAENVDPGAVLVTDEWKHYKRIGPDFAAHLHVNHTRREYVNGLAYTNTAECFFSIFKRGLNGTFHSVSKRHLHRYAGEFEFRWNARDLSDGERTLRAIKRAEGKRLLYRWPRAR